MKIARGYRSGYLVERTAGVRPLHRLGLGSYETDNGNFLLQDTTKMKGAPDGWSVYGLGGTPVPPAAKGRAFRTLSEAASFVAANG